MLIRLKAEFATIGVLIISFAYLTLFRSYGFQIEDEGTLLFHLDRAARGEAPYTDFHTGYTPGYYWLGSNALEAVDRSIVALRSLLAVLNATSAALLYKVARYRASAPLALLAPLAWLAFMPVYPGSFAMFNVPYPAWLATLCWLALAIALLTWEARRSLGVLALCGVIASLAFSIKLNAGAYAAAACVWVVIATARSDSLLDRAVAILATLLVACGVWVAFATRFWGIDAGIHLLPLVAIVALALWDLRGRFATETDVGALHALIVLTGGFLPLTAVWTVPTLLRLGVDGFASDVLLLGSNAADIYWRDHPAVEPYAFAVALGVIGFAAMGRLVARRLIPLRIGIASTGLGMACVLAFALTVGVMPEGRTVSVAHQLQNAAYWLAPLVHWGALVLLAGRLERPNSGHGSARIWVLVVCSIAMYWQLYPRTDFAHVMFAVPLTSALAVWLLANVLSWWTRGATENAGVVQSRLVLAAAALGVAIAAVPISMSVSAPIAAWGGAPLTGSSERLQVHVEEDKSAELAGFGRAVDFLSSHMAPDEPLLAFPALGGLTFAAGLSNPVEHDYWFPERPDHDAEEHMLTVLREHPPRFVATINTGWTFFFDSPAYFTKVRRWIVENYRLVRRFDRFDILARNDVLVAGPTLAGGLAKIPSPDGETEPPAIRGYVARIQKIRAWSATLPDDEYLQGLLSLDPVSALLQLRGVRDGGDLRCAALLYTGYESNNERLRLEAAAAASMVVERHDANVYRWADDVSESDYAPYLASVLMRAQRHIDAPDEGIRELSALVLRVLAEAEPH